MLFKVGRSFASKLKALSVCFCLIICQVESNFWIWNERKINIPNIPHRAFTHLGHAQAQHEPAEPVQIPQGGFRVDCHLDPLIQYFRPFRVVRAREDGYGDEQF